MPCSRCFTYKNVERAEDGRWLCEVCREKAVRVEKARARRSAVVGRHPEVCASCGEPFVASREWQRFCSARCRLREHRRRLKAAAV